MKSTDFKDMKSNSFLSQDSDSHNLVRPQSDSTLVAVRPRVHWVRSSHLIGAGERKPRSAIPKLSETEVCFQGMKLRCALA